MYDDWTFTNKAATQGPHELKGGKYGMDVKGSNYGTVTLQKLAADGTTYVDLKQAFDKPDGTGGIEEDLVIGSFGADGYKVFDLPPGVYQVAIASATAVYVQIVRIPNE